MPWTRWQPYAPGLALAVAIGAAGSVLAQQPAFAHAQVSPLTIALVLGMGIGNVFGGRMPAGLSPGIVLAQQKLLRLGIVLYGLRITFQQIAGIGLHGLALDLVIVCGTLALGVFVGRRLLGLDEDTTLLTAAGSAICGAAAVLAVQRVLRPDPSKVSIAVATVVLFGTLDVFLYPWMFPHLGLDASRFGLFTGATVHEVAQVVAAATAVGPAAADAAVVVKLTRVMLLVPVLVLLGWWRSGADGSVGRIVVPWFALGFVAVAALNSVVVLTPGLRGALIAFDAFALSSAMAALGFETRVGKLRALGPAPLVLALVLFGWLLSCGYLAVRVLG